MEEVIKHINDTNASYRSPNAGDAKNTDLFLDNDTMIILKNLVIKLLFVSRKRIFQKQFYL